MRFLRRLMAHFMCFTCGHNWQFHNDIDAGLKALESKAGAGTGGIMPEPEGGSP